MKYIVKVYTQTQEQRDGFVCSISLFYSFLSGWQRGEFNRHIGNQIHRFGIYEGNALVGLLQLVQYNAKRGRFFLAPHSPLIQGEYFTVLQDILPQIKQYAKQYYVDFLRINGVTENTQTNFSEYRKIGFRWAPLHMHAEETHLLDLTVSQEELLKNMRKTTRYMVTRAQKEGVIVEKIKNAESIQQLITMHRMHAKRANGKLNYVAFSEQYLKGLLDIFGDNAQIFRASYKGVVEAICLTIKYGGTTSYYIGASDIKNPKFSPAYLLQRTAIQYAKQQGCTLYNFWGVSPDDNPKHPLHGVSFFKRGFGGKDHLLTHAQDYIFHSRYWMTYVIERWRRWKRGYWYVRPK